MSNAPLAGLRVLDVSSVLSGPMAAMLLADLGAEVIKVENPAAPDFTRSTGNRRGGMTGYFYNLNKPRRTNWTGLLAAGRHPMTTEGSWTAMILFKQTDPSRKQSPDLGD